MRKAITTLSETLSNLRYKRVGKHILVKRTDHDEITNCGHILEDGEIKTRHTIIRNDITIYGKFINFHNYVDYDDGSFRPDSNLILTIEEMRELLKIMEEME